MEVIDIEELVGKIKGLPPLNLVIQKLLCVVENDRASAEEVTSILSSDQAIASKVLALVNSSFYGFPSKITTISRAVVILGNKSIQNLALGFAAMDAFKDYKGAVPIQKFWMHAIAVAIASQNIAKHIKYPVPEEFFIGGLLHDIGQLILSLFYPEHYNKLLEVGQEQFLIREKEFLGVTHQTAGSLLLMHWKIPTTLTNMVNTHHAYESYEKKQSVAVLSIAEFIASLIERESLEDIDETTVSNSLDKFNISGDNFTKILMNTYVQTIASEESFDIKNKFSNLIKPDNSKKTVIVLSKNHVRRKVLAAALRFMSYTVYEFNPKDINNANKISVDGVIFDTTSIKSAVIRNVCEFIETRSLTTVVIESDIDILLSSPTIFVKYPFALSIVNKFFFQGGQNG